MPAGTRRTVACSGRCRARAARERKRSELFGALEEVERATHRLRAVLVNGTFNMKFKAAADENITFRAPVDDGKEDGRA